MDGAPPMTLGSHQKSIGTSQSHFTPKWILEPLGPFDLDPCAGEPRPWDCATLNLTEADDGLAQPWHGRVFLNPPFDRRVAGLWVQKLADHGNGICLLHARTETAWFRPIWQHATAILFLDRRVRFCDASGCPQAANSGAPVCLATSRNSLSYPSGFRASLRGFPISSALCAMSQP